jgi:5-methylcytosine-specific restriction endonuclease McrA
MISPLQPPHNKGGYPMPHKDPDARRAYMREWKRINAEKVSRWAKEDDARRHANERAAFYGAPGELTLEDVRTVLAAGRCHYCGCSDALMTIDHVIPLHAKGPNTTANIVAACRTCNLKKRRGDHPDQWAQDHDVCCECGTTDHPYKSNGRCDPCFARWRYRNIPDPQMTCDVPGVFYDKASRKWRARFKVGPTIYDLGRFADLDDAIAEITVKRAEVMSQELQEAARW